MSIDQQPSTWKQIPLLSNFEYLSSSSIPQALTIFKSQLESERERESMASSGGIKGFYKQKKKAGVSKPSKASGKKRGGGTLGAGDPPQTAALIAQGSYDLNNEYGEEETKLRQFDMDMKYGPCVGITRLQRWERADSMGLNPPEEIGRTLRSNTNKKEFVECLWEGRV